ncbi:DUF4290 domain-containing protein [Hoylesella marshii]|uniref:DUF4290 domain-containing protein n=1 Tax=Hoylesella marshii TaxID=189722 RepID=UPI0028D50EA8|nr:DUF4290 domain-containing protein [Hoylesella marshii]
MDIKGLDYNTQRERLVLPEYGRGIQRMVNYAMTLPDKEERQRCAETIVGIMARMFPQHRDIADYKQKFWDHLAIMSHFQLDIDYPCDVSHAQAISEKPEPIAYPDADIPVRHYGRMMFEIFNKLKTMEPGEERDELVRITANQMKRSLMQWSHGSNDNEKVASDLARFTDGIIQLDLDTFQFERISVKDLQEKKRKKK